ncbi:MAG: hypothetical protein R3E58_07075 [Phycisphaerae bacterium]
MTITNIHRMTRRHRLLLVAMCACIASIPAIASDADKAAVTTNPETQALLDEFASANDASARESLWEQLRQSDRADRVSLIQQVTLFASDAKSTRAAMVAGAVIKEFDMTGEEVVAALVPMMTADDSALQKQIKGTLAEFEDQSASRPPDFSMYRVIIANELREGRDAPAALVEHMYDVDPSTALLTMMRASQMREPTKLREILWAEHVVSDSIWKSTHGFIERNAVTSQATEQLDQLAHHPSWWARLYVPAVMKRYPALKSATLLEDLQSDQNESVAAAARKLR